MKATEVLSPETIYQKLKLQEFDQIINILNTNRRAISSEPNLEHAINTFMMELFRHIRVNGLSKELQTNLDILIIMQSEGYYKFKDEDVLQLLGLLCNETPQHPWYKVAVHYPNDPVCRSIIDHFEICNKEDKAEAILKMEYKPSVIGAAYSTEIRQFGQNEPYLKVFIRDLDNIESIQNHLEKLPSVRAANASPQRANKMDLTVYTRKPFMVKEMQEEVELTLDNHFSNRPSDPIFKENVISSISDIAYYQIMDYMLRLGENLEKKYGLTEKWDEERYRDYFIQYLDALSEKHSITGETFNHQGRTDILVRDMFKQNVLIAECKLWKGEAHLGEAISQLFLRYIHWRDEKTALVLFNTKMKDFTGLIKKAIDVVSSHELCYLFIQKRKPNSFSFLFRHADDPQKLIKLELLLFNFC